MCALQKENITAFFDCLNGAVFNAHARGKNLVRLNRCLLPCFFDPPARARREEGTGLHWKTT